MSIFDIFYIAIVLFAVVLGVMFTALIWYNFKGDFSALSTESAFTDVITSTTNTLNLMDYTFLTIAIGLPLISAVLAFMNPIHPAFTFFAFIITLIFLIIAPQLANIFVTISTDTAISSSFSVENNWKFTTFIMQNYPMYIAGSATLIIIALFAKPRED